MPETPPPIRLAAVSYLNTLPLIEGLEANADVALTLAAPSRLLPLLESGEADFALAPVIDVLRSGADLEIVPAGAIGCDGATLSVRLFSTVPFERAARVHADADSHTSVALARWLLRERFDITPEFVEFDARERVETTGDPAEWPDTMLMIGDKVVTDSPPAVRYPHQLDLGEAWREETGLPFVYAVWMRRAGAEPNERERAAIALLDRQRRYNRTRLDWIVTNRAHAKRWPTDLARDYLGSRLRYDVDAPQRDAIERFLREAVALGLAPDRPVRWLRDPAPCPA